MIVDCWIPKFNPGDRVTSHCGAKRGVVVGKTMHQFEDGMMREEMTVPIGSPPSRVEWTCRLLLVNYPDGRMSIHEDNLTLARDGVEYVVGWQARSESREP